MWVVLVALDGLTGRAKPLLATDVRRLAHTPVTRTSGLDLLFYLALSLSRRPAPEGSRLCTSPDLVRLSGVGEGLRQSFQ